MSARAPAWLCLCFLAVAAAPAPRRIVSLAPNLTATLAELGMANKLVGISTYCAAPRPGLTRVGGYLDPDIETIVSLKPDLVITPPNPRLEKAMRRFAIPLRVVQAQWSTLADIRASIQVVADAVGASERGEELVRKLDARLKAVRLAAQGRKKRGVLFVIQRQPGSLIVAGRGSHLSELIDLAGGSNVVVRGGPYPNLDIEQVVRLAPEVIIDVSPQARAADTAALRAVWADHTSIPAVQSGHIHGADPSLLVQPGPDIGASAELLLRLIQEAP